MKDTAFEKSRPYLLSETIDIAQGGIVSKQILKNSSGNITLFAFDKGQGLSEHTAPFDAMVEVIEGRADVTIGGETHDLGPGEVVIMPANIPHALTAAQPFKMLLVMIKEK
jgi:quercetin dioxygenase-like cupin family protein